MPTKLLTTLKKLDLVSEVNRVILKDFYEYMRSKDLKSEHHTISLLALLISLDTYTSNVDNYPKYLDRGEKRGVF
jgi:hypothetical protein